MYDEPSCSHEGAPPGSANAVSCRSMPNTGAAAFPCHTYIHSTPMAHAFHARASATGM